MSVSGESEETPAKMEEEEDDYEDQAAWRPWLLQEQGA